MAITDKLKYERLYFSTRKKWRDWLEANHDKTTGIWFVFYKKHSNKPTLTYDEAVEEALCFGWIDSLVNKLDDERNIQLFTPRKPKSPWSRLNKTRIKKLIAEKLMTPIGMAKIDQAKQDGSWTIYDDIEDLVIPEDLEKSLQKLKGAHENFTNFSNSNKKMLLWWIKTAKRAETRTDRIQKLTKAAQQNKSPLA
jgi:uncharacterized protein YdeI (YjbR/CyaY-like superfamily)